MTSLTPVTERILVNLANELGYKMDQHELEFYKRQLADYPIETLAQAAIEATQPNQYDGRTFPSLHYFKSRLSGKLSI